MKFKFNSLGQIKQPKIAICRIDLEMIGYINAYNVVIKPTFCTPWELTFTCDVTSNHYDCLRKDMVLEVEDFGRFLITGAEENTDGQTTTMSVSAQSYEVVMNKVNLTFMDDVNFLLWDDIDPAHGSYYIYKSYSKDDETSVQQELPTLLYLIAEQTGWTIGHVDASLYGMGNAQRRVMSIDGEQAYGLLMGDIADSYKVYFEFDTMNRVINCYNKDENKYQPVNTGINFSFRNLIKERKISESNEDVITALTIKGAEGVGINLVNPLGNDTVYDFGYYMNDKEWGMPKNVQDAVTRWMEKIEDNTERYNNLTKERRELNAQYMELSGKKSVAESELKALLDVQAVDIAGNNESGLKEVYPKIAEKENEIKGIESEMAIAKAYHDRAVSLISGIQKSLSFEENFTEEEYNILKFYINASVYENANFIFTTDMPEHQRIETAEKLYEQGMITFKKVSRPLYEYSCSIAPFMFDIDYEEFTKHIVLGGACNVERQPNEWVEPRLLQLVIDYDNPENATAILSDSFRLMDSVSEFSNGFNSAVKTSRKTSIAAPLWDEPTKSGFYGSLQELMNNALNLTNQEIINADNQEFTLGSYGLRGKMWDEEKEEYDPHQVAMTNNVIAFTKDNWQSASMAVGHVYIGNNDYYGVVAEALVGNLIAGNQLVITDNADPDKATFRVDSSGAKLTDADFMINYGENTKITLSGKDGFKIQKNKGTSLAPDWEDILTEDTDGNIIAKSIKIDDGNIGGWIIKEDGLYSPTGSEFIKSNGTGHLGLMRYDNSSAWFDGNIYANNLIWNYGGGRYDSIFNVSSWLPGFGLMNGSVSSGKLDPTWVGAIEGTLARFEQIEADLILVNNLKAGKIVAGEIETVLAFGGIFEVGNPLNPEGDKASMWGGTAYLDSTHGNVMNLYEKSTGDIYLDAVYGSVKIGHRNEDNSWDKATLQAGTVNADRLITRGLEIDSTSPDAGLSVNGKITTSWLGCSNQISTWDLNVDHDATITHDLNCNATIFTQNLRVYNSVQVNQYDYGQSARISFYDKDGKYISMHFERGIYVGT